MPLQSNKQTALLSKEGLYYVDTRKPAMESASFVGTRGTVSVEQVTQVGWTLFFVVAVSVVGYCFFQAGVTYQQREAAREIPALSSDVSKNSCVAPNVGLKLL